MEGADEVGGEDTEGHSYASLSEMWKSELATEDGRTRWYAKATSHWQTQEANLNGILGGYPETNGPDLRESRRFLEQLGTMAAAPGRGSAMDCGAGIGRVTGGLLVHLFDRVDVVEQDERLLATARTELTDQRVERFVCSSLQQLEPEHGRYDVIWIQWVLLYLPDDDLVRFLQRCAKGLARRGAICVKENVAESSWLVDREDNSIARTDTQYKALFKRAGLRIVHEMQQACWPTDLIPVRMYALRPAAMAGSPSAAQKKPAAAR